MTRLLPLALVRLGLSEGRRVVIVVSRPRPRRRRHGRRLAVFVILTMCLCVYGCGGVAWL